MKTKMIILRAFFTIFAFKAFSTINACLEFKRCDTSSYFRGFNRTSFPRISGRSVNNFTVYVNQIVRVQPTVFVERRNFDLENVLGKKE